MKTWKTKKGCMIVRVLSGRSNAYLILNDINTILIDTGQKTAFGRLKRRLDTLNIPIEEISTLIFTHTHFDHCQSAKRIQEKSGCRIIVSSAAADYIQKGYSRLSDGIFPIAKLISKFGVLIGKNVFGYEPFQPDILVNGDFIVNDGRDSIKIIKSTGHSDDSVSILVENEIAIVGDLMFGVFRNSIIPPYADSISEMIESWGILLNTGCKIFLPGHGGEIKRNLLEKEFEKYTRKFNYNPRLLIG
jgi:glyoxylase-like metal-dependent hydrolase (beta-lactamase superfamily II)